MRYIFLLCAFFIMILQAHSQPYGSPQWREQMLDGRESTYGNKTQDSGLDWMAPMIEGWIVGQIEANRISQEKKAMLRQALLLIKSQQHREAALVMSKAIRVYPNESVFYEIRGTANEYLKNVKGAFSDYSKAISLGGAESSTASYSGMVRLLMNEGKLDAAFKIIEEGLRVYPYNNHLYFEKGRILRTKKDYRGAASAFNVLIKNDPEYRDAFYERGICYFHLEDFTAALINFNQAIRRDRNNADIYTMRGVLHYRKKAYAKSEKDLTKAIGLQSDNETAYYYRAFVNSNLDKADAALADLRKACKLGAEDACKIIKEAKR